MRGKKAPKRKIIPDTKYNDTNLAKFINAIMKDGKKSTATRIVYDAFDIIAKRSDKEPLEVFDQAIKNISPFVEVRGKRVGGANYQIPVPVKGGRRLALAYRWLIEAARTRKGKPMSEKLADELLDAFNNTGSTIKKKEDVYRMAESNRAFAHFAR